MQQFHVFANGDVVGSSVYVVAGVVLLLLIFFTAMSVLLKFYKRCPSNRILVIYGRTSTGEAAVCLAGGGQFVKPLIQDYAWLSLEPMRVEIELKNGVSADKDRVSLAGTFTVAIGTTVELMQNAAIRLLGLSTEEIANHAEEIIAGSLGRVIAAMRSEDLGPYDEKFHEEIEDAIELKLEQIGLTLISVNITDVVKSDKTETQ